MKKYVSISDAAERSKNSKSPLTDRDVFDLVADRRIALHARFNESYPARMATVTPSDNPDLSERVDYGDALPAGVRDVFPLWLGCFDRPFVNSAGEFQTDCGCLHFGTDRPDTLIVVEAATLPAGAEWLVDLTECEDAINRTSTSTEKPIATTERNTLLCIIAAISDYADIKIKERGAASQISKLTQELGVTVSDDVVRRVLEKIPGALESRKK